MKKILLICSVMIAILISGAAVLGDTGTYEILDYRVNLTPRSDGSVDMTYYQVWKVTGGHIPWITVGTPNDNYQIVNSGEAVKKISSANEGGWSGVRLDLDRDYKPGETFKISFSIVQRSLFYATKDVYRLDFTPGWYDRAVTDTLRITVKFFAKLETVKANPKPTSVAGQEMTWVKTKLGKGERFSISVSFPKALFPKELAKKNVKQGGSAGSALLVVIIVIVAIIIIVAVISSIGGYSGGGSGDDDSYSGGGIFYGGGSGEGSGTGGGGGDDDRSGSGGGGFGGGSISCACACVSCACACACAGGGGAGCSRKLKHSCPLCQARRRLWEK